MTDLLLRIVQAGFWLFAALVLAGMYLAPLAGAVWVIRVLP